MGKPAEREGAARWARAELEVDIDASVERVWKALVSETAAWWREPYTSPDGRFAVEAFPGGRMYEDRGAGKGVLWAHVVQVDPPHTFDFACDVFPQLGGPMRSHVSIRLVDRDGFTRLRLTDGIVGRIETTLEKLEDAWRPLFGQMLKAYAEGRRPA